MAMPQTTRDWQRALFIPLTILAWLAVIVVALWLMGHVAKTVLTLVLSGVVAFALTPLVRYFQRYMNRGLAIALAYLIGFTVILGFLALIVVTAAGQVTSLVENLPHYLQNTDNLKPHILRLLQPFGVTSAQYDVAKKQAIDAVQSIGKGVASQSLDIVTGVLGTVVDVLLILILSVYLTADGARLTVWLRRETHGRQRRNVTLLFAIVNQVVGGYIRGSLTMAALIGFLVGAGMLILQVPYAVLLGILAFFMEFVPVVGVLISGAVSIGLAGTKSLVLAAIVLGYFILVHVLEGDVIGPRIMGRAVGIHPATALVAFVAGTELFGVWGALFASPLAGLLQAIGTAIWREMHGGDPAAVLNTVIEQQAVKAKQEVTQEKEEPTKP
jgi:predicted PurR-regulated permease PerM